MKYSALSAGVLTIVLCFSVNGAAETALVRNKDNVRNHGVIRAQLKEVHELCGQIRSALREKIGAGDRDAHTIMNRAERTKAKVIRIWQSISDANGKPGKKIVTTDDMKTVQEALTRVRAERDALTEEEKQQEDNVIMGSESAIGSWQGLQEAQAAEVLMEQEGFVVPGVDMRESALGTPERATHKDNVSQGEQGHLLGQERAVGRQWHHSPLDEQKEGKSAEGKIQGIKNIACDAAVDQGLQWHQLGHVPPLTELIKEYAYMSPWVSSEYTPEMHTVLQGEPGDSISAVAIGADSRFMVVGGRDGQRVGFIAILRDINDQARRVSINAKDIKDVAISLHGGIILVSSTSNWYLTGDVQVLGLDGELRPRLQSFPVNDIALNEADSSVLVGSRYGACVLNFTGDLLRTITDDEQVFCVAMNGKGQLIALGRDDGYVLVYDALGNQKAVFSVGNRVFKIAIDKENEFIALLSAVFRDTQHVDIFDLQGAHVVRLEGHRGSISALATGFKFLVTGSADKTVRIWDTSTWQLARTINLPDGVTSLAISPDEKFIAVTTKTQLYVIRLRHVRASAANIDDRVSGDDTTSREEGEEEGAQLLQPRLGLEDPVPEGDERDKTVGCGDRCCVVQ